MEKSACCSSSSNSSSTGIGNRFSDLNKSFKLALCSLLTSCSNQEFHEAFSSFTNPEKELLHRLFLEVITSLHENIEEEFESICLRTQVGATLDTVEEIMEERDLDPLSSDRSNIMDVAENLSMTKKNELKHLMHMVQLGEEQNQMIRARLQVLREGKQVLSGASEAVQKLLQLVSELDFWELYEWCQLRALQCRLVWRWWSDNLQISGRLIVIP